MARRVHWAQMSPRTFGQGDVAGPGAADHVLVETSSDLYGQGETFTGVYTYGNSLLRRNSEYPLYDGHGSERTVTASSQSVSGTINFEAFGQTAGSTGSSSSPYMYAGAWGYRTDGDAGLMHVGARYYDAEVGRFITRDTVLSEHPYLYCEHDAVNAVDPSGCTPVTEWLGNMLGMDFNFYENDWRQIIDGWRTWGRWEIGIGTGGFGCSLRDIPWIVGGRNANPFGSPGSRIWVPKPGGGFRAPVPPSGPPVDKILPFIGGGLVVGGAAVMGGARIVERIVDWIYRP